MEGPVNRTTGFTRNGQMYDWTTRTHICDSMFGQLNGRNLYGQESKHRLDCSGCSRMLKKAAQRYENNAGRPFQQPVSQHALSSSLVVLTVQSQSQYYA